jgi:hypothetical protein
MGEDECELPTSQQTVTLLVAKSMPELIPKTAEMDRVRLTQGAAFSV